MEKRFHARRAIVAVATAAALASSVPMSSQASEIQRAYAEHTRLCIGLFFSDTKAHAAQCLPNTMTDMFVLESDEDVALPPPPVVVPEPEPEPECEGAPCGPLI